jgi:hypothetical protein
MARKSIELPANLISEEQLAKLEAFAERHGLSLQQAFIACFADLLSSKNPMDSP